MSADGARQRNYLQYELNMAWSHSANYPMELRGSFEPGARYAAWAVAAALAIWPRAPRGAHYCSTSPLKPA
eukprot:1253984-Pyramimonas_sp.AAC.1